MGRIVKRYRFSRYNRFLNGLLFAMVASVALWLCVTGISEYPNSRLEILLPFIVAVISMILGFVTMVRQPEAAKGKA